MVRATAVLVLAAIILASMPVAGQVAVLQGTASADPSTLAPGTTGRIELTLTNVGNASITRMEARIQSADPGILASGSTDLGGLTAKGAMTVSPFAFEVPSDTKPGTYTIRVAVTYIYTTGTGTGANSLTLSAPVRVASPATLLVSGVEPSQLSHGSQQATFTLTNQGAGTFTNILGTWTSEADAILAHGSSSSFFVAAIGAGNATKIPLQVAVRPDAAPGFYALTFQLHYQDPGGAVLASTSVVGVQVASSGLQVEVSIQDAGRNSITLAATNVGPATVTGVQIHVVARSGASVQGRDTAVLGNLERGQFLTAEFDIASQDVDHVVVAYTDGGVRVRTTQALRGVAASGMGDIIVSIQALDSDTLTLAITNTGLTPVTGVQATLIPRAGLRIRDADTLALGPLEPGAFGTLEFEVSRLDGDMAADVVVAYTDDAGARKATTQAISREGASGSAVPGAAGLLAAVLVGGGAFLLWRRRKAQAAEEAQSAEEEWERLEEPGWERPE